MKKVIKRALLAMLVVIFITSAFGHYKPLPEGISVHSDGYHDSHVTFLYDLSYEKDGEKKHEQEIFTHAFQLIDEAEDYILIDMFLFNDDYDRMYTFPDLSHQLTEKLVEKKNENDDIEIVFITDRINTFYHSYPSNHLETLKDHDIQIIETDMTRLRDSNWIYSGFWRTFLQWFGTGSSGWLANPFSPDSPQVTVRSYLELLNFKANHRKIILTEKQAMITSANAHDGSAYHSNMAFLVAGPILKDILASEKSVANFSGGNIDIEFKKGHIEANERNTTHKVMYITEGKIRAHVLDTIQATKDGDDIRLGMFYLSDRKIVQSLLQAATREVNIQLILDPNKDAFGREKNGIPNRSVASELVNNSNRNIHIRWYHTTGEQYHSKFIYVTTKENKQATIIGGSANFTKRNIGDYNLEANLKIVTPIGSDIETDIKSYFQRLWNNEDGTYTLDYDSYQDDSLFRKALYRFQEWSGLSTF